MIQLTNCVQFFDRIILQELSDICNCWIAGGAVRDYFSIGKLTSDIDIYFDSDESYNKCKAYLLERETRTIVEDEGEIKIIREVPKAKAKQLFENDNVLKVQYRKMQFDLVKKTFASAQACIEYFDFTVCSVAVDRSKIYHHETFFIDLAKRQLMINHLPFPMSTMWRMQKYIKKGFFICSGEMLKLAKAVSALELHREEKEKEAVEEPILSEGGRPRFRTFD